MNRHHEERSDVAIQSDAFATPATAPRSAMRHREERSDVAIHNLESVATAALERIA
jgi:hypothetical protein